MANPQERKHLLQHYRLRAAHEALQLAQNAEQGNLTNRLVRMMQDATLGEQLGSEQMQSIDQEYGGAGSVQLHVGDSLTAHVPSAPAAAPSARPSVMAIALSLAGVVGGGLAWLPLLLPLLTRPQTTVVPHTPPPAIVDTDTDTDTQYQLTIPRGEVRE